ncbi:MAG: hypothetical protein ABI183_02995 [Polyangiaceae bacterium]
MRQGLSRWRVVAAVVGIASVSCKHPAPAVADDAGARSLGDASASSSGDGGALASSDAGAAEAVVIPCTKAKGGAFTLRFGIDGKFNSDVGVDACDNIVLAGSFKSPIDFGGGPLASDGSEDIFVAKFASSGAHVWSEKFGDQGKQHVRAAAIGPDDDIYITGDFDGSVSFGGKALVRESKFQSAIYLVRLDTNGNEQFSRFFVDTGAGAAANAIAVDKDGSVIVAGKFAKAINMGGGPMSEDLGGIFVAEYNKYGGHQWSRSFAAQKYPNAVSVSGVAVGADGDIILAGTFENSVDFSDTVKIKSAGKSDMFIASFAKEDGKPKWAKNFGDKDPNGASGVVTDSSGNSIAVQWDERKAPGGPEWKRVHNLTLHKLDPKGKQLFQKYFPGGKDGIEDSQVAVGPGDEIILSGTLTDDAALGGKPISITKGQKKTAVARFDSKGAHQASAAYGDDDQMPFPKGLVVDSNGEIVLSGVIDPRPSTAAKLPTGKLPYDVFLQKIAPE